MLAWSKSSDTQKTSKHPLHILWCSWPSFDMQVPMHKVWGSKQAKKDIFIKQKSSDHASENKLKLQMSFSNIHQCWTKTIWMFYKWKQDLR